MTKKKERFFIHKDMVSDTEMKIPVTLWQSKEQQKKFCDELNKLNDENEQLRKALKNSYINEICENCKYGYYSIDEIYGYGFEGNFECKKKHFGNEHWKCCELTECDDFELDLKGDDGND